MTDLIHSWNIDNIEAISTYYNLYLSGFVIKIVFYFALFILRQ